MSQPCDPNCNVSQPGEVDEELNEFWVGNPWTIFQEHNLSAFERNRMYLNAGGRKFLDVSFISAADHDGDARSSIAVDLNHDGMLDLVVRQAGGVPLLIYENEMPKQSYLKVTLRGIKSNHQGLGARVIAHAGAKQIVRELFPANSFLSLSPTTLHFGLGESSSVERLEVVWPSGVRQELKNIPADSHIVVTEGVDEFAPTQPGKLIAPAPRDSVDVQ